MCQSLEFIAKTRILSEMKIENCQEKISRVPDQNGVSLLYVMLEIGHSGWEPSIFSVGGKIDEHTYFTMKIKMMDL